MCKDLNINEDVLRERLRGNTCGIVGNEALHYTYDVERAIRGLPQLD